MLTTVSSKPKPPPWIPPGKGIPQYRKKTKPVAIVKSKKDNLGVSDVSPEVSPQWGTVDVSKKEDKGVDADVMSLSSHSSFELERLNPESELDIHHVSLLQEMKLLYVHFASLKTSYLSAHRLIDSRDIEDSNVNELFIEVGSFMKTLNALFDDLEYSVSVLENTLNENQKKVEFSTVLRIKEKLLFNILAMYEKVILIFQVVFEKHDFKELLKDHESLCGKLKIAERKCASQEAVITDLERRLSIYQSKAATMETYKTNLESAKIELEKKLLHKESQIKYLTDELLKASGNLSKSDREDFIEIIEDVKSKAYHEKSALKKALKFLKVQSDKKEETFKKLLLDTNEKEKMMFDLASQRDQLKVQLTVVNNNIIQLKHQIEEIKIQNLKLQKEMSEKDMSHTKEMSMLKCTIEEKSTELDGSLKKTKKLEETVSELENDLKKSKEQSKVLKDKAVIPKQLDLHTSNEIDMHEEISRLVALLQSTREMFENITHSGYFVSSSGDHIAEAAEFGSNRKDILTAVTETKKCILELKSQLSTFLHSQRNATEPKSPPKKNDLEKELKKVEHMYNSTMKENEFLKQKLEDLRSSNLATSAGHNAENYFSTDTSGDNVAKKLQVELYKKDNEITTLKLELAQRENDLENHLKESKDKLRKFEIDYAKTSGFEEELKNTKLELAVLQKKKAEEAEYLLRRVEELQESVDKKTTETQILDQYIQQLKSSYFRVFCNS